MLLNKLKTHEIIKKGISIIPKVRSIFPKLTIYENLYSGIAFLNNNKNFIEERINIAINKFPILKKGLNRLREL